jgi:hypothetical protein
MTTFEQSGVTGGVGGGGDDRGDGDGGDERRKRSHDDIKDTESVKKEVITTASKKAKTAVEGQGRTRRQVRIRRGGGLAGRLLSSAGTPPRRVTPQIVQEREAAAIEAERVRQEQVRSIAEEFWGAFGEGPQFERSPVSAGRHLRGGTDPDDRTIAFFADRSPETWLIAQAHDDFVLTRTTSTTHGPSISFTVYFLTDREPPRRSVAGHLQDGRFVIVHIGPVQ